MAEKTPRRTLRIPRYTAPTPEERQAMKERRAARREELAQKKANAPATHRRNARRETQQRNAQRRIDHMRALAAGDPIARLKTETRVAQDNYLRDLRVSDAAKDPSNAPKIIDPLHRNYSRQMVMSMMRPMRQGINPRSILAVAGTGAAMWATSPMFREHVGSQVSMLKDLVREKLVPKGIIDRLEARTERKGVKSREALARLYDRTGRGEDDMPPIFKKLHAKRLEKFEKLETLRTGEPVPMTEQSAALTQIGLTEAAYAAMRQPGADPEQIRHDFDATMNGLYLRMEADGVDRSEMEREMRTIVGLRMDSDPQMAAVFSELGSGQFMRAPERELPDGVELPEGAEGMEGWDGEFVDVHTGTHADSGTFSLRMPASRMEHMDSMAATIAGDFGRAQSIYEFDDMMTQYIVGASMDKQGDTLEQIDDPEVRSRLGRSRAMFAAMKDDGLSQVERSAIYADAYAEGLAQVERENPRLAEEWGRKFGDKWSARMLETVQKCHDMTPEQLQDHLNKGIELESVLEGRAIEAEVEAEGVSESEQQVEAPAEPEVQEKPEPVRLAVGVGASGASRMERGPRRTREEIAADMEALVDESSKKGKREGIADLQQAVNPEDVQIGVWEQEAQLFDGEEMDVRQAGSERPSVVREREKHLTSAGERKMKEFLSRRKESQAPMIHDPKPYAELEKEGNEVKLV